MEPGFFLDLADNNGDNFFYFALLVQYCSNIPWNRRQVTLMRSLVRSRTIDSIDGPTCCKTSDGFEVFNRHVDELFDTEEMELNRQPSLFTTDLSYLNDEPNKVSTPLPNL